MTSNKYGAGASDPGAESVGFTELVLALKKVMLGFSLCVAAPAKVYIMIVNII